MPTFNGTTGNDTIDGSVDPDDIYGDEGEDQLYGHGGDDEIYGEEGDDALYGGQGDDTLEGGAGEDTLFGGADNDSLEGGDDNDLLFGEEGNDVINGGAGNDTIGNDYAAANLITNGSFEDGTHTANGVNGLTGWSNTSGSPDSADDGAAGESWNPANYASDGTGYITMWGRTSSTQEAMQQTLASPLVAGTTYTMSFDGISADYVGGQWFTPTNIPVTFELYDPTTATSLGTVTVQSTTYEPYQFSFTPTANVSTIAIRPVGEGVGTYPSFIIDDLVLVEGTGPFGEDGDDTIDGGTGDDVVYAGQGNDEITGGEGADTIYGEAGDDVIFADDNTAGADEIYGGGGADTIHANGDDTVDGGAGGIDADVLNLNGSGLPGGTKNIVITGVDSNGNGNDGYVEYFDSDGILQHTLQFSEIETIIPCFTPGTLIKTIRGEVPVEQLRVGDRVLTIDSGFKRLEWIGTKSLSALDLSVRSELRPIHIAQGALGNGLPERDMMVSPQHRMLINTSDTEFYFGAGEVLIAAKHLTVLDGINRSDAEAVDYIHIMCDAHEIVCSDGAWSETFQPNDLTLDGHDGAIRKELSLLFPQLDVEDIKGKYMAARPSLKGFEARVLFA